MKSHSPSLSNLQITNLFPLNENPFSFLSIIMGENPFSMNLILQPLTIICLSRLSGINPITRALTLFPVPFIKVTGFKLMEINTKNDSLNLALLRTNLYHVFLLPTNFQYIHHELHTSWFLYHSSYHPLNYPNSDHHCWSNRSLFRSSFHP